MATLARQSSHAQDIPQPLREHYVVEKELAQRLRQADKAERRTLYSQLYDELFRRVPHHIQLTNKLSPETLARRTRLQMAVLGPYLHRDTVFMEIGPGDCALSFHVAQQVRRVHAIDVSDEVTRSAQRPSNFELSLSDGSSIPVPPGSITLAYSNQLMEHLHPDDALEQLINVYNALAPNGTYVCITPNRMTGPHDVSRYFDTFATGFHLKEYSTGELGRLFRRVGFRRIRAAVGGKGTFVCVPYQLVAAIETLLDLLPPLSRRRLAKSRALRWLMGVRLIAQK
jgi:SAM-dependent methyltransferase